MNNPQLDPYLFVLGRHLRHADRPLRDVVDAERWHEGNEAGVSGLVCLASAGASRPYCLGPRVREGDRSFPRMRESRR